MSTAFYLLSDYINVCHIQIKSNFSDLDYNKHIIWAEGKKNKTEQVFLYSSFPSLVASSEFQYHREKVLLIEKRLLIKCHIILNKQKTLNILYFK